uniref:Uncharacterized protein n=1 Tax=Meloidogyne incognita TaxID=6306 RepID=A0A914N4M3_MELIC
MGPNERTERYLLWIWISKTIRVALSKPPKGGMSSQKGENRGTKTKQLFLSYYKIKIN